MESCYVTSPWPSPKKNWRAPKECIFLFVVTTKNASFNLAVLVVSILISFQKWEMFVVPLWHPYSVHKMPHVLTKSARWNSWPIFRQKIRGNPRYIWLNQWIDILGLWLPSLKIGKVTGIIQKFSISTCQFVTCYCFICFCHGKNSTFWHRLVAIPTSKSKRQRMRTCPSSDENSDLCQTLAANLTFPIMSF